MTETAAKDENFWQDRVAKLVIVFFVFPILVLVFHLLLTVPTVFVDFFLAHFGGHPGFLGENSIRGNPATCVLGCDCRMQTDLARFEIARHRLFRRRGTAAPSA